MTSPYTSNRFVKASVSTFGEHEGSSRLIWYKMLSRVLSSNLPVILWRKGGGGGLERLLTNTFEDISIDLKLLLLTREQTSGFLDVCQPKHNGEADQSVRVMLCTPRRSWAATILPSRFMSLEILCTSPCAPLPHSSPFTLPLHLAL
jgi:hypothetical protein